MENTSEMTHEKALSKALLSMVDPVSSKPVEHTKRGWLRLIRIRAMEDRYNPKVGIDAEDRAFYVVDISWRN